jgi:hypothetical protein
MQPEQQQETNIWQGLLPPVQPATLDTTKHSLPSSTHIDATQRRLQVTIGSLRARHADVSNVRRWVGSEPVADEPS